MRIHGFAVILLLCALPGSASAQASPFCELPASTIAPVTTANTSSLFCMDLVPIPDLLGVRAVVELQTVPSANGVAVTRDGHHRYRLVAHIDRLPAPSSLSGTVYVAWIATVSMDSVTRLGVVREGANDLGIVAADQFRVLVSAERDANVTSRSGRIVLRGTSPSMRLMAHRDMTRAGPLGGMPAVTTTTTQHQHDTWPMPPMDPRLPVMAGMAGLQPDVSPFLPAPRDTAAIPFAQPRRVLQLNAGDTLGLEAGFVRRRIAGRTLVMYGFNGQYPGPLIVVKQSAEIVVEFRNAIDAPSTIHWHGVRLDNRFDGVPHVTQELVPSGGRFFYRVRFPDAGMYWYHPHHREDIQQDLGLYGNLMVEPAQSDYYGTAHRTEALMLDDLLVGEGGLIPFGADTPTHALMGRFGNVLLVNGEPRYTLQTDSGAVVRFFFTNVSNTRVFNLSFAGLRMKLVGSDVGRFEREEWIDNLVISPAERYSVDVLFPRSGRYRIENRVRALNHVTGTYFASIDTLGTIEVSSRAARPAITSFETLRQNQDVIRELNAYRPVFDRPADRELVLSMRVGNVPPAVAAMATGFPVPVDWNDAMGMMNWATTGKQVTWTLRDTGTGRENMDVTWRFRRGELLRLRIVNDPAVFHAMSHPIHIHGQRVLVLRRNGIESTNRVWKDTALVQAGETVELLVELSNPGKWMLHCHIAEHLGAGMMMVFEVE